jgi:hypothetical protein
LLTAGKERRKMQMVSSMFNIYDRLREAQGQWLLIFDNADFLDNFDLSKYFPKVVRHARAQGNIIITSRDPSSAILTAGGLAMDVGELPQGDAVDLLLQCACKPHDDYERDQAAQIVEELGRASGTRHHSSWMFHYQAKQDTVKLSPGLSNTGGRRPRFQTGKVFDGWERHSVQDLGDFICVCSEEESTCSTAA